MTRRRAAWVAAVVAVLLGVTYVMTRRSRPVELAAPPVPPTRREPTSPPPVATAAPEPEPEPEPELTEELLLEPAPTAPIVVPPAESQSWDGGRAVPARTPPPAAEPLAEQTDVEEPLPTWVRVSIVAGALLAFFAVSLIATKQV